MRGKANFSIIGTVTIDGLTHRGGNAYVLSVFKTVKRADGKYDPEYFDITIWKDADKPDGGYVYNLAQMLCLPGVIVDLSGRLRPNTWTPAGAQKPITTLDLVADDIVQCEDNAEAAKAKSTAYTARRQQAGPAPVAAPAAAVDMQAMMAQMMPQMMAQMMSALGQAQPAPAPQPAPASQPAQQPVEPAHEASQAAAVFGSRMRG
jgi:hypothetical protein